MAYLATPMNGFQIRQSETFVFLEQARLIALRPARVPGSRETGASWTADPSRAYKGDDREQSAAGGDHRPHVRVRLRFATEGTLQPRTTRAGEGKHATARKTGSHPGDVSASS